ncbi:DUF4365 domain-containing protein [candidate division WOR-3 bacterium]|jgi:hypothetical protein|nr:DUF4365 domain-containing protein [candidate division WOR-3 bacterium]
MADHDYKQYTKSARRGIKGEAFFESLIVDHAIPHRIARQNDLGIDFLCEWIYGDRPTGILFSAQVKATTSDKVICEAVGTSPFNGLLKYTLMGAKKVDERTINYWKGLGLPAFLFYIVENGCNGATHLECYHKRYTPLLDGHLSPDDESGTKSFFQVSNGASFLAFADFQKEIGGFARDLIMDYVRLSYSKGHVVQLTPRQLGFWPFPNKEKPDAVRWFDDPLKWHREMIEDTCRWTTELLTRLPVRADEQNGHSI